MKTVSTDFRVREEDAGEFKKRPTLVDPVYRSKKYY
jgi:hypothetical protein